jgi:hypothetical protein
LWRNTKEKVGVVLAELHKLSGETVKRPEGALAGRPTALAVAGAIDLLGA